MERKIATSIFGEVPYATFPEALEPLLRVEVLNKTPWKENRLIVAKCYVHMGETHKALEWLDNAFEVPCKSLEVSSLSSEVRNKKVDFSTSREALLQDVIPSNLLLGFGG